MRLKTKTDAKGQVFNYSYDGYNRLTQISAGSTVLRTYVYDTNTDDSQYSQYPSGRLVEVKYTAVGYSVDTSGTPGSTMFTDMFSYTQAGQVAGKRLRLTQTMRQTNPNTHQQFTQTATGDLNLAYAYNNEGKVTQVTYPTENSITPIFSYSYDSMMRLSSMTDGSNYSQPVVNGAVYNAANQLAALNYYDTNETRAYNNLLQLTNVTASSQYYPSTSINVTYNYTPGGDSGKITSTQDAISGEAVVYQYDALNRLISAQGSGWAQTQAYDGFGNLTGRTGTGTAQSTTISTPVNAATNQLSGYSYDANGNLISTGYSYDVENRMSFANGGGVQYFYDAQNKRVWQASCITSGYCTPGPGWVLNLNQDTVNLFGADGKQLASYQAGGAWNPSGGINVAMGFSYTNTRVYFGGRLVGQQVGTNGYLAVIQDRLGSVGKYYPYGEERNSPQLPNDQVKFATYTRDSATGNDYADQRYYTSVLGRFLTADHYKAFAQGQDPRSPQTWNQYAYTTGDPMNRVDPLGEDDFDPDLFDFIDVTIPSSHALERRGRGGFPCGAPCTSNSYEVRSTLTLTASGGHWAREALGRRGPSSRCSPTKCKRSPSSWTAYFASLSAAIAAQIQAELLNIQITTSCDVQVYAQSVPSSSGGALLVHTFIEITIETFFGTGLAATSSQMITAGPQLKSSPDPNNPVDCTQQQAGTGQCWLNNVSPSLVVTLGSSSSSVGGSATLIWDSGFSSAECAIAQTLLFDAGLYPNNTYTYGYTGGTTGSGFGPGVGFTSNSFVYTLLTERSRCMVRTQAQARTPAKSTRCMTPSAANRWHISTTR